MMKTTFPFHTMRFRPVVVLIALFTFLLMQTGSTQNLNNPNKKGPMGLQVNTLTGNLFIPRLDFSITGRTFDIRGLFFYNSFTFGEDVGYGNGWSFLYNIRYRLDTGSNKTIIWGDGREDGYVYQGNAYRSPIGFFTTFSEYQPGKFLLREKDGKRYFFENGTHKRITRLEDPNGNFLSFTYSDTLLTGLTNAAGQSLTFAYKDGRLSGITDANATPSRSFQYAYDAAGNLATVTDPLNGKTKYTYLVNGPMKSAEDKNNNLVNIIYYGDFTVHELVGCNRRISFSYDSATHTTYVVDHMSSGSNQVTKYQYQVQRDLAWLASISGNCCGFDKKFEFDQQGNKVKETDANGNSTSFTYDNRGNLLTVTDPMSGTETFTWSADFNKVTSYKDKNGAITTLTYDVKGNLIQITEPGNATYTATYNAVGDLTGSTDPNGNVYTYTYDAIGNPISVTGPNGYQLSLQFDGRSNLLSVTDARGNKTDLDYDILSRLKKITDALGKTTQYSYDAMDNQLTATNEKNETTVKSYDASNRIVQYQDVAGKKIGISYDALNNIRSITNALGNSYRLDYDDKNRLTNVTDEVGSKTAISHDGNGNITSLNLPNGQVIQYSYDALDRVTGIADNDGPIANLTYDKKNNVTSYTNGVGNKVSAEYDELDRLKKLTDALGNTSTFTYDSKGNIATITDRNGFIRTYTYDGNDRMKTFTDPGGSVISITYDNSGNITQLKDQNNNITIYTYNALNRVNTITYPDGKFVQFTYDDEGNITGKRLTNGSNIVFIYDAMNRILSKTFPDGVVYSYAYDDLGRLVSASNNNGVVTLTYDAHNRITSEAYDGRIVRYSYNPESRTQTTVYPDSTVITRTFDTRNRLTNILKNNAPVVSYEYNNADQVTKKTLANGITTNYQYDFAGRLINLSTGSGTIQNTIFGYNKERNKTFINRLNLPSFSEEFTYDNRERLTLYKRGPINGSANLLNSYTYDNLGNRTAANLNGTATTYTNNNLNQITGVSNGSATSVTYDDNGNRNFTGTYHKRYDNEGKLLSDSASPTNVIHYAYDALGRRVIKNINGVSFKYSYSGLSSIEERDGASNSLLNRTVYSSLLSPVLTERYSTPFYYHQNELNSVEAITNSAGSLVERYAYDAYGKTTRYDANGNVMASSLAGNRFGFTGQEYDSATGGYHFFYRNYTPDLGTFDQRDLIHYADGMGLYQYVGNNPANGIDMLGLNECDPPQAPGPSWWSILEADNTIAQQIIYYPQKILEMKFDLKSMNNYSKYLQNLTVQLAKEGNSQGAKRVLSELAKVRGLRDQVAAANAPLEGAGKALGRLDVGIKAINFASTMLNGEATWNDVRIAGGDLLLSGIQNIPNPVAAGYGAVDFAQEKLVTGKSLTKAAAYAGTYYGNRWASYWWGVPMDWSDPYEKINSENGWRPRIIDCPQNGDNGGTRRRRYWYYLPNGDSTEVISALDPNEIIGPEGYGNNKWVAAKDRLPYTITYENDKSATAPAKYVRITAPIQPKMDATTFELGTFGFNNLTFSIPAGTSSYYNRVDARDSLGLYIDVTAGYDQFNNVAFWEFQSIDPTTLLPPTDPLKGFLLLQDSVKKENGHGFVNFSIKPLANSATGDTISAIASIVFDQNTAIETNRHKNTIDAVAPVSSIASLPTMTPDTEVPLQLSGIDDATGIRSFAIYVSENDGPIQLYVANFRGTDTTFRGLAEHQYKFYVAATDNVGNTEQLKLVGTVRISNGEQIICPNGNTTFESNMNGTTYQWQVDNGTGYTNLSDGGVYSGTTTAALSLTNAPSNFYGYRYRCLVNSTTFSNEFVVKFAMTWNGTVDNAWENIANWSCNSLPDMNTDVIIAGGRERYPQVNSNVFVRTLRTQTGASVTVKSGFNLTVVK